jgi:hypothetical protein
MKAPLTLAPTPLVLDPEVDEALRAALRRGAAVSSDDLNAIQTLIWDTPPATNAIQDLLYELAYDLEYARADLGAKSQYTSRFGAEKALGLIAEALEAIANIVRLHEEVGPVHDAMQADPGRGIPAKEVFDSIRTRHADRLKKT